MAKDDVLQDRLKSLSSPSSDFVFEVPNTRDLREEFGYRIDSPNPIYRFRYISQGGADAEAIAFTLILKASARPASRAQALAQAIFSSNGDIFKYNPLLLIYDYGGDRFMAVSAAKLFGAFVEEAGRRTIPPAATAHFSLTPGFDSQTINMYAQVGSADIWYCADTKSLTTEDMVAGLQKIESETAIVDVATIVDAVRNRFQSDAARSAVVTSGAIVSVLPVSSHHGARDEAKITVEPRIWRMILTAIRSSPAVILVGPPGTGKTALLQQAIRVLSEDRDFVLEGGGLKEPLWATPDESWTVRELAGGDTIVAGEIRFRPGWVLRAIAEDRWLVLDEANRADMDRIFGGLLTWLSGGRVSVGTEKSEAEAREIQLGWTTACSCHVDAADGASIQYLAGKNWRLLGTYNALDAQRVFRFGQALGRRFLRVPVPAVPPAAFHGVLEANAKSLPKYILSAVTNIYEAHYSNEATLLGPAIFLSMCNYLNAAKGSGSGEQDTEEDRIEEEGSGNFGDEAGRQMLPAERDALAEAYVVHVGTWLAQLEQRDIDILRKQLTDSGTFDEADWTWINSMLSSLA